mgnify:CR=1 FL=1
MGGVVMVLRKKLAAIFAATALATTSLVGCNSSCSW